MNSHLTTKQLAELLNVSERHIHRMNAAGKLPRPKRIGRCIRWDPDEVQRMLDGSGMAGRRPTDRR
jgi:excisionase family DNA binding protein